MNTKEKQELADKFNITLSTFYSWEKNKPELIKIINKDIDEDSKNEIKEINDLNIEMKEIKNQMVSLKESLNKLIEIVTIDKIRMFDKNIKAVEK